MKIPSKCRGILLGLAAGIFLACDVTANEQDLTTATPAPEKQAPQLLLANVWNPSIDPTGWWMSEKYDGLRGYWDGRKLWSRKGNLIHPPDYFLAELPRDVALDGELWIGYGKFEETASIVRSEKPDDRWKRVRYMVFDAPQAKGAFEERMQFLRATLPEGNQFVRIVAQEHCKGATQLLAERDRVVRRGGEGLMLRQPASAYEVGRSPRYSRSSLTMTPKRLSSRTNPGLGNTRASWVRFACGRMTAENSPSGAALATPSGNRRRQ